LLEKGIADAWGSYSSFSRGWFAEAFRMLTGVPIVNYLATDYTVGAYFDIVKQNLADGNIVGGLFRS